jgi:hypothetical protein
LDDDLRALKLPIQCGNCNRQTVLAIGELIDSLVGACSHCASALDLDTDDWREFRRLLEALASRGRAPVAPVKEQS